MEDSLFSIAADHCYKESIIKPPLNACKFGFRLRCKPSGELFPKPYNILSNIRSVQSCMRQNIAIDINDNLWIWGAADIAEDDDGRCSYDLPQNVNYIPEIKMENVRSACTGALHTLCITNEGILWAWGNNDCGQLGCGDYLFREIPVAVMEHVKCIYANEFQSYAITNDNVLWAWGSNENRLFLENISESLTPIKVMDNISSVVSDGENFSR